MSNSALMSQLVQRQTSPLQQQPQQMQGGMPGKGGASIPGKGGGATPTVGIPRAPYNPVMAPPVQMPPQAAMAMQRGAMGSPNFRDQAMGQVMGPFTQPNWGVPQVVTGSPGKGGGFPAPGATPRPVMFGNAQR
jgi:hypothetical protein